MQVGKFFLISQTVVFSVFDDRVACTQALFLGNCFALIARSKHVGLWRARERRSLQRSLYNLRSAPCSAWLICQIIKAE